MIIIHLVAILNFQNMLVDFSNNSQRPQYRLVDKSRQHNLLILTVEYLDH